MIKYKKHTIEVTQKHIDEGIPTSCTDCAISLAFKDSLVKANVNNCLVQTNMSDGEVQLQYTHDGSIFGANLDSDIINLQYKIDAFVKEYDEIVVELKQGQGLFFNQYLVHRGGVNTTGRTRFNLVTLYHSMSNPKFSPYYLQHPKSPISSDEFFDETMLGRT